jgi:hypothetical protein
MKQTTFERKMTTKKTLTFAPKLNIINFDKTREQIYEKHTKCLGKPTGSRARSFTQDMLNLYYVTKKKKEDFQK